MFSLIHSLNNSSVVLFEPYPSVVCTVITVVDIVVVTISVVAISTGLWIVTVRGAVVEFTVFLLVSRAETKVSELLLFA